MCPDVPGEFVSAEGPWSNEYPQLGQRQPYKPTPLQQACGNNFRLPCLQPWAPPVRFHWVAF